MESSHSLVVLGAGPAALHLLARLPQRLLQVGQKHDKIQRKTYTRPHHGIGRDPYFVEQPAGDTGRGFWTRVSQQLVSRSPKARSEPAEITDNPEPPQRPWRLGGMD